MMSQSNTNKGQLKHNACQYEYLLFIALNQLFNTNTPNLLTYFIETRLRSILIKIYDDATSRALAMPTHETVFVKHIENHLKENESIICTICGKDIYKIFMDEAPPIQGYDNEIGEKNE